MPVYIDHEVAEALQMPGTQQAPLKTSVCCCFMATSYCSQYTTSCMTRRPLQTGMHTYTRSTTQQAKQLCTPYPMHRHQRLLIIRQHPHPQIFCYCRVI